MATANPNPGTARMKTTNHTVLSPRARKVLRDLDRGRRGHSKRNTAERGSSLHRSPIFSTDVLANKQRSRRSGLRVVERRRPLITGIMLRRPRWWSAIADPEFDDDFHTVLDAFLYDLLQVGVSKTFCPSLLKRCRPLIENQMRWTEGEMAQRLRRRGQAGSACRSAL